jgi:hypothetical protein
VSWKHVRPAEEKILLTGNSKDFDTSDVRAYLTSAGIHEYFADTGKFLGWFQARQRKKP